MMQTIQLEDLLGAKVRDARGNVVGRIEEVIAEPEGAELLVTEYHTGGYGMLEHLSSMTLGDWFLKLIGRKASGYIIRWDQLDVTNALEPLLLCNKSELQEKH
jgi:hypothetical protein